MEYKGKIKHEVEEKIEREDIPALLDPVIGDDLKSLCDELWATGQDYVDLVNTLMAAEQYPIEVATMFAHSLITNPKLALRFASALDKILAADESLNPFMPEYRASKAIAAKLRELAVRELAAKSKIS